MEPMGDGSAAEAALSRFVGQTVYVHAEAIPGGFLRNMRVEVQEARVRGHGSCRVALRCPEGWVRVEDLQEWEQDPQGRIVFVGYGKDDRRMTRTLEIAPGPFTEPLPQEDRFPVDPAGAPEAPAVGESPAGRSAPSLLAALAHPDDETFICGGGLAAFAAAGGRVHLVCATRGEHGRRLGDPPYTTREGLPVEREAELREACRILGIGTLVLLGLRDKCLEFEDDDALAARVALHIRRLRPGAVLTFHERRGGHTDHATMGRAATLAWQRSGESDWHPEQLADGVSAFQPPRLYYLAGSELAKDPSAHGLSPDQITAVDCRPVARRKMLAFRAHRTQTQMDKGLWDPDEAKVLKRFADGREYYQQVCPPFVAGERGLLGLAPG